MMQLHQFPCAKSVRNISPYCLKVETFLKMANLPYEVVEEMNPGKAPNKKLPFIVDQGKRIADSELILDYLIKQYNLALEQSLTEQEKAIGLCLVRTLEEHFIWTMLYNRWADDRYWPQFRDLIFKKLPLPLQFIIPKQVRKSVQAALWHQGMSRHSTEAIENFAKQTLSAISILLCDKTFLFGEKPTRYDATLYAFVANVLYLPLDTDVKHYAQQLKNLVGYCERMRAQYF